jgi:hypothetical protein
MKLRVAIVLLALAGTSSALAQAAPKHGHAARKPHAAHTPKAAPAVKAADAPPALPPPPSAAEPPADAPKPAPEKKDGPAAPQPSAAGAKPEAASTLAPEHQPKLTVKVDPPQTVKVGQLVHLEIAAVAPLGDDVTIADQPFAPFEIYKKQARVEPPQGDKQRFVFNLDLLALEAGDKPIPATTLRVVTKDSNIGTVETESVPYKVQSLVANEPNAQPKLESKPVAVLEDNYIPIYVLVGLLAAAAVAGITLLVARYLRKRQRAAVPPPPPRPPWEIAVEKLAELRRQKTTMLQAGQGGSFVDQLSDVVRAYLGGRYLFDGLETTSDEMLMQLKAHGASLGFTQEVGQFLYRCDLVKFAKVEPDEDEVDLLFAKAQDLVHMSEPERAGDRAAQPLTAVEPVAAPSNAAEPPRDSRRPHDGDSPS